MQITASPRLTPLVEPGRPLGSADADRYSRQIVLPQLGVGGQRCLSAARVLVVGAGGLGSPALLYLAAAGVGTLGIADDDEVERSNLQRQIVHTDADAGRHKVASARDAVHRLNPAVTVREHRARITAANAVRLLKDYDVVIDGTDDFASRYLLDDAAALLGMPCVWGSVLRFEAQVSVSWAPHAPTYRDLYPEAPDPEAAPVCGEAGVLGVLCGLAGSLMAAEALKIVTGIGSPLVGRVVVFDLLTARWRELRVTRDPATPPVTLVEDRTPPSCTSPEEASGAETLTPRELVALLRRRDAGEEPLELIDVRNTDEHEAAPLPGSRHIALPALERHPELAGDRDVPVVVHCQSGVRSERAARVLLEAGYTNVRTLAGGAIAWMRELGGDQPGA